MGACKHTDTHTRARIALQAQREIHVWARFLYPVLTAARCAASAEEAGRYLETLKAYEHKPADQIKGRVHPDHMSQVRAHACVYVYICVCVCVYICVCVCRRVHTCMYPQHGCMLRVEAVRNACPCVRLSGRRPRLLTLSLCPSAFPLVVAS
jgi:hypothetical protein